MPVAAGLAAAPLLVSGAWACTLHVGTLTVCNGSACVSQTAGGSPIGGVSVSSTGSSVQVKGQNFNPTKYTIRFLAPGGFDCHDTGTKLGSAVNGPNWSVTRTTPASATGNGQICVQDTKVATGNEVPITVI